jgi:DNA-binding HxlR family transcriptional regulator
MEPDGIEALRDVLDRIGDKWSVTVICRLDDGPLRFNALRRATEGITQRMLTATVRRQSVKGWSRAPCTHRYHHRLNTP